MASSYNYSVGSQKNWNANEAYTTSKVNSLTQRLAALKSALAGSAVSGSTGLPDNPYKSSIDTAANNIVNPYASDSRWLISRAKKNLGANQTDALRTMYMQDVQRTQDQFGSQLRGMGMGELALAEDVTNRFATERQNATTRAATEGASLQNAAYSTLSSLIQSASGQELDYLVQQLQAQLSASSANQNYQSMLLPYIQDQITSTTKGYTKSGSKTSDTSTTKSDTRKS